jgi:hypothetical protein
MSVDAAGPGDAASNDVSKTLHQDGSGAADGTTESISLVGWWHLCVVSGLFRHFQDAASARDADDPKRDSNKISSQNKQHHQQQQFFAPDCDPRAVMVRVYENGCVRRGYHTLIQMDYKRFRQCLLTAMVLGRFPHEQDKSNNAGSSCNPTSRQAAEDHPSCSSMAALDNPQQHQRQLAQALMNNSNVVDTYAAVVAAYRAAEASMRLSPARHNHSSTRLGLDDGEFVGGEQRRRVLRSTGIISLPADQRDVFDLLAVNERALGRLYEAHVLEPGDPGFEGVGGPRKMPFARFQSLFHSLAVYPTLASQVDLKRCFTEACCSCLLAPAGEGAGGGGGASRSPAKAHPNPRAGGLVSQEMIRACVKTSFLTFTAFLEGFVRVALATFSSADDHLYLDSPARKLTALLQWTQNNIRTFPVGKGASLRKLEFVVFENVVSGDRPQ